MAASRGYGMKHKGVLTHFFCNRCTERTVYLTTMGEMHILRCASCKKVVKSEITQNEYLRQYHGWR